MSQILGLLLLCGAYASFGPQGANSQKAKFKAAVYEHALIMPDTRTVVTRAKALEAIEKNMKAYREQAALAKQQGVKIIVFPEDGLYGYIFQRDTVYPFLETIPDPRHVTWSPCDDPGRFLETEIQHDLSCIAKDNSMYVVADMGDKQPCDVTTDHKCPQDGRYQYNTAVAYGPDGRLLARYHKFHLYYEYQFDTPDPEVIFFDTPFGRFGLFICFDVLFHEPAVPMVKDYYKITNIAFPTAWMDALPLLSAIGFHSSFARAHGVNFLSANLHIPDKRFHGSGIFGPDGMKAFYYNNSLQSSSKLVVAELDILDAVNQKTDVTSSILHSQSLSSTSTQSSSSVVQKTTTFPDRAFTSELFKDYFTFLPLVNSSATLNVCQKEVCCHLDYTVETKDGEGVKELFAFGAFDGQHEKDGVYYFQICALVKCASDSDRSTCGTYSFDSNTEFSKLDLSGSFGTKFVYPQMVLSEAPGNLRLAEANQWSYRPYHLSLTKPTGYPLVSAALFGRHYSRDDGSNGNESTMIYPGLSHLLACLCTSFWGLFSAASSKLFGRLGA